MEVQAYKHLFKASDALKTKNFKNAKAHLEKAADIFESNQPNLSGNLQLYLVYLFWRTGEKEKLIEAAHRYVASDLKGMEQRSWNYFVSKLD